MLTLQGFKVKQVGYRRDLSMNIKLCAVKKEEKSILFRLLQYSLFEESISDQNEMNDEAIFEYQWFDAYFTESDREAYFIREEETDKLLGFVMVNTYVQKCEKGHSIAEFMIIPKCRRKKIGKKAAIKCFEKYIGNWEVSPSYGSESAYLFWKSVIDEYTDGNNQFADGIFLFTI